MTTMPDYLALPGVSWSSLSYGATSWLAYHDRLLNPPDPSPTMILGSAIHKAVLEPDEFADEYILWTESRQTNEYAGVAAGAAEAGVTILSANEWEQCMGAAEAVWKGSQGKTARRHMRGCRREHTLRWIDPKTHIRCKARPDLVRYKVSEGHGRRLVPVLLDDVKTSQTVDERRFGRTAADLLYHGKMAFARRGLEVLYGVRPEQVSIIAVEQKRPWDVGVFPIDEDVLDAGEELVDRLLAELVVCRRKRTWPGRYAEEVMLDFPSYALPLDEDGSLFGGKIRVID